MDDVTKLISLYMRLNYSQFCKIVNEGREDSYSEEKWNAWIDFNRAAMKLGTMLPRLLIQIEDAS